MFFEVGRVGKTRQTSAGGLLCFLLVCGLFVGSVPLSNSAVSSLAAIDITQDITVDTVWTVANSPYTVMNNITVANGTTLTIEPGVTVLLEENVLFTVKGSLVANGNASSRITFKSVTVIIGPPDYFEELWIGLKFAGESTEQLILKFADIQDARNGVAVESLGKVLIEGSQFYHNTNGVQVVGPANALIRDNYFLLNRNGVSAEGNISSGIEISNNLLLNHRNGVLFQVSGNTSRIFNVKIVGNNISNPGNIYPKIGTTGVKLVSDSGAGDKEAQISNVTILGNSMVRTSYGVLLQTVGLGAISDLSVSNNTVAFSYGGIEVNCGTSSNSSVANVTVSWNQVFSSRFGISLFDVYESAGFDITVFRNIVSANNVTGVSVLGGLKANLTENSVSYNSYGIVLESQGNLARRNDVYNNTLFGMYVNSSGTISAVENFWGDSTGPFHDMLNLFGKGDRVNGNGVNLSFNPWLNEPVGVFSVNQRPVAKLSVSGTRMTNQTLTFNALDSSDDVGFIYYGFDFGDGNVTWTFPGALSHVYKLPGVFNASLVVMDYFGVLSVNPAFELINVTLPSLTVYVILSPPALFAHGNASVAVHVTNGSLGVEGVMVELSSDRGGSFSLPSGWTDSNGDFNASYLSPEVSSDVTVTITAYASKKWFINASNFALLPVLVFQPGSIPPLFGWLALGALLLVVAVVLVVIYRRRRGRRIRR